MAKKRVIDIYPPKEKEAPVVFQNFQEKKEEKPGPIKKAPKMERREGEGGRGWLVIILLLILISAGGFCYFKLAKATINIWPKTEILTLTTKLTIDKGIAESNFINKIITGETFEKEKVITDTFPATGKTGKEQKAGGTIKVYNEYSASSQVLIANTRFVSTNGKVFRILNKITIPGFTYDEKRKVVPGTTDVKVLADQAGAEYNIEASTFSIPGFAGSEKYTKFYGKSSAPMAGGLSQKVSQVTKEDLDNAKITLSKKAKQDCESSFLETLNGEKSAAGYIFIDKAIQTDVIETFSLAAAGTEGNDFGYQVKAKSRTIIFKKQDLGNFVKQFVLSQMSEGKSLSEKETTIRPTLETANLDSGKLILSLDISAKVYSDPNVSNLKESLKGKTAAESQIFLQNFPEIDKSEVKFWPFWVGRIPEDLDKIQLNLNID